MGALVIIVLGPAPAAGSLTGGVITGYLQRRRPSLDLAPLPPRCQKVVPRGYTLKTTGSANECVGSSDLASSGRSGSAVDARVHRLGRGRSVRRRRRCIRRRPTRDRTARSERTGRSRMTSARESSYEAPPNPLDGFGSSKHSPGRIAASSKSTETSRPLCVRKCPNAAVAYQERQLVVTPSMTTSPPSARSASWFSVPSTATARYSGSASSDPSVDARSRGEYGRCGRRRRDDRRRGQPRPPGTVRGRPGGVPPGDRCVRDRQLSIRGTTFDSAIRHSPSTRRYSSS